jgi:hypothetical protein
LQTLKSNYVAAVRRIGDYEPFARLRFETNTAQSHGWRRWAASLFAIYNAEEMMQLDLPWWNVAATVEAEAFLRARPNARIFEWGSGASTVWLSRRAEQVVSIEHDANWHSLMAQAIEGRPGVTLLKRDLADGSYANAIHEYEGDFDLIVVDGRQRAACLEQATAKLRPGGFILFDNSGRRRYRSAIANCGLEEQHFFGRTYCVPYPDHTSFLRRRG